MTESAVVNSWIAPAVQKARLESRREILLEVLHIRFPQSVSPEVEAIIQNQTNLLLLKDWVSASATAESIEAFIAVLRR